MSREKKNPRDQQGITKITVTDATFAGSAEREIVPSWINFFYGNNGSGKTTISRAIRNHSAVSFKDGTTADDYNIAVFNQDFVANDLRLDQLPGVFMLGKENIEDRKQLDEKQEERKQKEIQWLSTNTEKQLKEREQSKLIDTFRNDCWKAAARYKNVFGGSGNLRTKALCATKILNTNVDIDPGYDFDTLKSEYKIAIDPNAKRYDILSLLNIDKLNAIESYTLLGQVITSTADSDFARFMQRINAAAWVKNGHDHYETAANGQCPYCQQSLKSLTTDIQKEIAACFDDKYNEDCGKLVIFGKRYAAYMNDFITTVNRYIAYIPPTGFGDRERYKQPLDLLIRTVEVNNRRIAEKIADPAVAITLESVRPYLEAINAFISETNILFRKNNAIIDAKSKTRQACLEKLWVSLGFELRDVTLAYRADSKIIEDRIKALALKHLNEQNELTALKTDIIRRSEKLGGNALPVEVINDLLIKSGFSGFKLANHHCMPDKYVVIRQDGSEAQNLSEGEQRFIAFLYFYYLARGGWKKEDLEKNKIIVIDDPVSGVDSNVLLIIGSLVRDLIEDCYFNGGQYKIQQIFILTHNPYFHKDVSRKYETSEDDLVKKSAFFVVKKSDDNISTVSLFEALNPRNKTGVENIAPVITPYEAMRHAYR